MKKPTKKSMKKAPKSAQRERIPRYTDPDGAYLGIREQNYESRIGWYIPEDGDFGYIIENRREKEAATMIAVKVLLEYFKSKKLEVPRRGKEFCFESHRQAVEALRIINTTLHYYVSSIPLPEWARTALTEGWTPPKGWSPQSLR